MLVPFPWERGGHQWVNWPGHGELKHLLICYNLHMLNHKAITSQFTKLKSSELRKNMTLSEVLLWNQIKQHKLGINFDRQKAIGNYIVDFYCGKLNLIIEIDGNSHDSKEEYDKQRLEYLEKLNLKIIRIDDLEVKRNMKGVIVMLQKYIIESGSTPHTPPR